MLSLVGFPHYMCSCMHIPYDCRPHQRCRHSCSRSASSSMQIWITSPRRWVSSTVCNLIWDLYSDSNYGSFAGKAWPLQARRCPRAGTRIRNRCPGSTGANSPARSIRQEAFGSHRNGSIGVLVFLGLLGPGQRALVLDEEPHHLGGRHALAAPPPFTPRYGTFVSCRAYSCVSCSSTTLTMFMHFPY